MNLNESSTYPFQNVESVRTKKLLVWKPKKVEFVIKRLSR